MDQPPTPARRISEDAGWPRDATRRYSLQQRTASVWFPGGLPGSDAHPKPVSQYLVEQMKLAGCTHLFFIVRSGRWDIADYYGSGSRFGLDIGYRMMGEPWGPPFTLNLGGATVVLGFPDILIHPCDAIEADAVLATFPARADDCCDLAQATGASGWVGECG